MATETKRFTIPSANYFAVTAGHYAVFVRPTTPVAMRLHIGTSLPLPGTTDFVPIAGNSMSFSDLGGGDNVYLMAEAAGAEVAVVRTA